MLIQDLTLRCYLTAGIICIWFSDVVVLNLIVQFRFKNKNQKIINSTIKQNFEVSDEQLNQTKIEIDML